jgi:hypothetical protein
MLVSVMKMAKAAFMKKMKSTRLLTSHAATIKWASTPSGANFPIALAAPRTAAYSRHLNVKIEYVNI